MSSLCSSGLIVSRIIQSMQGWKHWLTICDRYPARGALGRRSARTYGEESYVEAATVGRRK